jgi:hypothetical protein
LTLLALLLAGCALMSPPLTPLQQQQFAQAEGLVTRAATAYGRPRPAVVVRYLPHAGVGQYLNKTIYLAPPALASPYLDVLVAHEFGHYVLGHDGSTTSPSLAVEQELAANAEAVRVLLRANGLTEDEAATRVHAMLMRNREFYARANLPAWALASLRGHSAECREANDLARRFPAVPLPGCR